MLDFPQLKCCFFGSEGGCRSFLNLGSLTCRAKPSEDIRMIRVFLRKGGTGALVGGLATLMLVSCSYGNDRELAAAYEPVVGDLLFQSLPNGDGSTLVDAIEGSTGCPFSHCGVVVKRGREWMILEAMVPKVRETPLANWVARGQGKFAAYRLKEEHREHIPGWIEEMRTRIGLDYDIRYHMSDEAIYCSELPYDGWKRLTGQEMGTIVTLGELEWEAFQDIMRLVEGLAADDKLPLDRKMITPRDLAKAPQLELVLEKGISVSGDEQGEN
jgi:hypothetical protein